LKARFIFSSRNLNGRCKENEVLSHSTKISEIGLCMNEIWYLKIIRGSEDSIRIGKQGSTWDNGDTWDNATWDSS
jgi:hypothetical protein